MKIQRKRDSCREQVLGRAFCSSFSYKQNEGGRLRIVRIVEKEIAYKEDEKYEKGEHNCLFFGGGGFINAMSIIFSQHFQNKL